MPLAAIAAIAGTAIAGAGTAYGIVANEGAKSDAKKAAAAQKKTAAEQKLEGLQLQVAQLSQTLSNTQDKADTEAAQAENTKYLLMCGLFGGAIFYMLRKKL